MACINKSLHSDPQEGLLEYFKVKHKLIKIGYDISHFHAAEDQQVIRDQFFNVISVLSNVRVDGISIRKNRLNPPWRVQRVFYPRILEYLLRYVFHPYGMDASRYEYIYIFLSKMQLPKGQKGPMVAGIKHFLNNHLCGVPFSINLHQCESNPYLQFVDYCCWALYVNRERGETRPLEQISHLIKSDFDIFETGTKNWYWPQLLDGYNKFNNEKFPRADKSPRGLLKR